MILFVNIAGFFKAGQILIDIRNNQSIDLTNSSGNHIYQFQDSDIEEFREHLEEKETSKGAESSGEVKSDAKDTIQKIENYLDEHRDVSTIARMCLRLAKELEMEEDRKWLENEVHGYEDSIGEEGAEMRDTSGEEYSDYRRVEVEVRMQDRTGEIHEMPSFKIFMAQPLESLESIIDQASKGEVIIRAPPMELMVQDLGVDPAASVPYVTKKSNLENVLVGARNKLNNFVSRAKEEVED